MRDKIGKLLLNDNFARGYSVTVGAIVALLMYSMGRVSGKVAGMETMDAKWTEALNNLSEE